MNKKTANILKIILPLLLGVFLIWYSLKSATPQEREELWQNILNANPWFLFLSMLFGGLSHLSRAYRWKFMLEPMGYKPKLANSFMAVMAGYLANFGIPRSGEVLRAASLSSYEKIPFEKAFGTIISERIADVVIMLSITAFTLLLQTEYLLAYFKNNDINPLTSVAILSALLFVGILVLQFIKKSQLSFLVRIKKMAQGLLEGMRSILRMKQKWAFIYHTLFIWLMYILMFYVIIFAVPGMEKTDFSVIMAAFVVGSFAISATNGGIGVYPVAIGAILVVFGITKQSGEAFGWITWGTQTLLVLILGGLSFIFLPIFNRQK
ncbi:flippase-like domain-containing protein [Salegentibacter sp. JZCK2]|uniref:lysylphosphatidylglycerol synthase transmembrane domain-containing protein n=1 Tax=Salegentibacter tibetensis TaxID=2873600 RepID=UPI001CCEC8F4|nr:lysylphosphatidylglycerol synthase transmembrane domain-containing protein [Salegentibacter tibetensis]MBZ9729848.1 flippase-like domain-containing protein [Salegentibacter tibetensis]